MAVKTIFALLLILSFPQITSESDQKQHPIDGPTWIMAVDVSPTERWEYWHSAAGTVKKVVYY